MKPVSTSKKRVDDTVKVVKHIQSLGLSVRDNINMRQDRVGRLTERQYIFSLWLKSTHSEANALNHFGPTSMWLAERSGFLLLTKERLNLE
eukprot:15814365-Heterocapsa_arctica.AAC.1